MTKVYRTDMRKKIRIAEDNRSSIEQLVMAPIELNSSNPRSDPNFNIINNTFQSLSNEGRVILKRIEDLKFKFEKALDMVNQFPDLEKKLEQKKSILNSVAGQVYGVVFDLENYDITPVYEEEQMSVAPPEEEEENADTISNDEMDISDTIPDEEEMELPDLDMEEEPEVGETKNQGGFEESNEESEESEEEEEPEEDEE